MLALGYTLAFGLLVIYMLRMSQLEIKNNKK